MDPRGDWQMKCTSKTRVGRLSGISGQNPWGQHENVSRSYSWQSSFGGEAGIGTRGPYGNEPLVNNGYHQYFSDQPKYDRFRPPYQGPVIDPMVDLIGASTPRADVFPWNIASIPRALEHHAYTLTQPGDGCWVSGGVQTAQNQTPTPGVQFSNASMSPFAPPQDQLWWSYDFPHAMQYAPQETALAIPQPDAELWELTAHDIMPDGATSEPTVLCPFNCGRRLPLRMGGIPNHLETCHQGVLPPCEPGNPKLKMRCRLCGDSLDPESYPRHFLLVHMPYFTSSYSGLGRSRLTAANESAQRLPGLGRYHRLRLVTSLTAAID